MQTFRGLGFTIFGAALLYLLWIGANNHYTAVADFKATHLEPNSGEVPKVHEKRQAPRSTSTGITSPGSISNATLLQTLTSMSGSSSIPTVSASTTAGTIASLASAASSATASDNGGVISDSDCAQFALILGIIGVVLVL